MKDKKDEEAPDVEIFRNAIEENRHSQALGYLNRNFNPRGGHHRDYGIYNRVWGVGTVKGTPYLVNLRENRWMCPVDSVEFAGIEGEARGYYKRIAEEKLD